MVNYFSTHFYVKIILCLFIFVRRTIFMLKELLKTTIFVLTVVASEEFTSIFSCDEEKGRNKEKRNLSTKRIISLLHFGFEWWSCEPKFPTQNLFFLFVFVISPFNNSIFSFVFFFFVGFVSRIFSQQFTLSLLWQKN